MSRILNAAAGKDNEQKSAAAGGAHPGLIRGDSGSIPGALFSPDRGIKKAKREVKTMILQTVSISAAPRELHIKLFKAHGDELDKLEEEIASLDAVALVSWARVFEAVKAPGVVAHWELQYEIDGKTYTEQRILHASVKNPGCIQFSTAHIYPDEYIPVMDSQFKNAADFFRYEAPPSAVVTIEKVA